MWLFEINFDLTWLLHADLRRGEIKRFCFYFWLKLRLKKLLRFEFPFKILRVSQHTFQIRLERKIIKLSTQLLLNGFSYLTKTYSLGSFIILSQSFTDISFTNFYFMLNKFLGKTFWQVSHLSIAIDHVRESPFHFGFYSQSLSLDLFHLFFDHINTFL